jgi:hypothetical protein
MPAVARSRGSCAPSRRWRGLRRRCPSHPSRCGLRIRACTFPKPRRGRPASKLKAAAKPLTVEALASCARARAARCRSCHSRLRRRSRTWNHTPLRWRVRLSFADIGPAKLGTLWAGPVSARNTLRVQFRPAADPP